ncbi:MAG: pyrophosphate--fructose-6-phosphate 1-phosphotransferase, partial [Actinomycetota bacterium]|nr:pyrophosphate--fructose-6-phosphate 1-phosphotransferase [Actinomycetota bacterium]
KTIDNDVIPIRQSLGAWTAADEGARFFWNVVSEHSANPRTLVVHEVMGRNNGWLTGATAESYRKLLDSKDWMPEFGVPRARRDVHAVFVPEMELDLTAEAERLKAVMDEVGNVNIFLSEGAGVDSIVAQMEAAGEEVPRDAFGHVRLDEINPGKWFSEQFAPMIDAGKVLIQKSGYYARAAAANDRDLELIKSCVDTAVDTAMAGGSGLVGHDEERDDLLRAIEFDRIKGGKNFDIDAAWFEELLAGIGQPKRAKVAVEH